MAIPAALLAFIPDFLKSAFDLIDDMHTSEEEKMEIKAKLKAMADAQEMNIINAQRDIIVAEAKSESWIAQSWRPLTMLTFTFIVANNYIIYPYLNLFFDTGIMLSLPEALWDLLKIGLGGYIVGRSAEKAIKTWKAPQLIESECAKVPFMNKPQGPLK